MVTGSIRNDRTVYQQKLVASFKENPKRFYAYVRSKQSVKTKVTRLLKSDGTMTSDDTDTADALCKQFESVFVKETEIDPENNTEVQDNIDLQFDEFTVYKKLIALKVNKSPGPDSIHPMFLSRTATAIAKPLSILFNCSYNEGRLPQDWKNAVISPIFKKGRKSDPENYRPISLTSVICKIMESIVRDSITESIRKRNLITDHQHGFIPGRSCLTNLLQAFEAWTSILDEGFGLDIIYLDYRKAFDTVPHKRLIMKLSNYGIPCKLLIWLSGFLQGRMMRVQVNGSYSSWVHVLSGVPQGSVLGPLLFLLYVNDLPDWIKSSIKMFADDTKLWSTISDVDDKQKLQDDLRKLNEWSDKWLLKCNPDKCRVMHVGHNYPTEYYMEQDSKLCKLIEVTEEKDLGVITTCDLKPARQCAEAAKKATAILRLIKRHFHDMNIPTFRILYKSFVRPHLEYCVQVWSPNLRKDIDCLERIQKRATKLVPELRHSTYDERLRRLGLTTLERRRLRGDLIETYKILTGKESIDSGNFFTLNEGLHNLRGHQYKLYKDRSHLNIRKFFFSQRVVDSWNKLPVHVVEAETVNCFKCRLDKCSSWGV